jgi:RNA polymerase sigma-70 factor, ECF subfamily
VASPPAAERPRSGGVPTWEEVARAHGRFLYSVAYRLCGNHADAQDLVQEVLVRVQRGLGTYQPGNLEGWLSKITSNAFLDELRRRRRRPADLLPEADALERVAPGSASAEEALAMANLPDHVQRALLDLPGEYRAAVVLSDVVGLSYEEIAEALGIPIGTVRSRIHRGRSRLKAVLAA